MEMILHGVDGLQLNNCPCESSPVVLGKPVKCIQYRQRLLYMLSGIDGLLTAVHLDYLNLLLNYRTLRISFISVT